MAALTAALLVALLAAGAVAGHPMHTSVTELTHDPSTGSLTVVVRVFADDFADAAGGTSDSVAAAYLRRGLSVSDRFGRPIRLQWQRLEPAGDALLLRLRGHAPAGVFGGRLRQMILCDRFADQVNVVRVGDGRQRANLLFVPGDEAKALP